MESYPSNLNLICFYYIPFILLASRNYFRLRWSYMKLCWHSLTHNNHMNASYATDVCMEPVFWIVDNYTHLLGPVRGILIEGYTLTHFQNHFHFFFEVLCCWRCLINHCRCQYCLLDRTSILVGQKSNCHCYTFNNR